MRGLAALALLAGVLPLIPGTPGDLHAQVGFREVKQIQFEGNESFSDEVLATAILTRETECRSLLFAPFCWAGSEFALDPYFLSEREFREDHARVFFFYWQRGYKAAVVDTVLDRSVEGAVSITFRIQEGDPILVDSLGFTGLDEFFEEFGDSAIIRNTPLKVGEPLSLVALDATRDTLETRLRNRGYAHADVLRYFLIPLETPLRALVSFDVQPDSLILTRFGPIAVDWIASAPGEGTSSGENRETRVSEAVIRRMLPFQEGDRYSEELLFAGQRSLYNLDLFRNLRIDPDSLALADEEPILPLSVQVEAGPVHRVRTGGGFSTAECLSAEARWSSMNFLGGARRLQLTGRMSNILASFLGQSPFCRQVGTEEFGELNWLVSAEFSQPWLFSPRNSVSASVFWDRQSLKDLFVRESQGATLGFTRALTRTTPLTFSFRPQLTKLTAVEVTLCSSYLICNPEDAKIFEDANWLSPVGVTFAQDRRNNPLSPTRGHTALVDVEYAASWTGSKFPYTRIISEGTWYTERGSRQGRPRWVFGARLRGGWVSPGGIKGLVQTETSNEIIHPEKRLYGGGANSVRGFAQNRLGPQVLYVDSLSLGLLLGPSVSDSTEVTGPSICGAEEVADRSCDANPLPDAAFDPRPTGGTALLEGSLEVRFPVAGLLWEGAAFLDFGEVWGEQEDVNFGDLEWTPGFGIRYFSPIGPIRVDLAYRFAGGDRHQVVTPKVELYDPASHPGSFEKYLGTDGQVYVRTDDLDVLNRRVLWGDLSPLSLRRFQLHLSIGQAF